jgi:hypothetical protein
MNRRKQRTLAFQRIVSGWRDTEPKDKEMMNFSHPTMTLLLACSSREETNDKSITTQGRGKTNIPSHMPSTRLLTS